MLTELSGSLDRGRLRELFDLRGTTYASRGGSWTADPYPAFDELRRTGPVHEGIVGPLVGYTGDAFFAGLPYPDHRHFSAFDFATCDRIFRDELFATDWGRLPGGGGLTIPILFQDGDDHRRYRQLVQPSFLARHVRWWSEHWVDTTVDALVTMLADEVTADLSVDFFAPIPLLTICGSFGVSVEQALDIRQAVTSDGVGLDTFLQVVMPIIAARREQPADDLISVLTQAHLTEPDTDGREVTHELSDEEILGVAFLLLAAGSGTTWKQMGIVMTLLLTHPEWLARVRQNPAVMREVIEEAVRYLPTDPMFSRWATEDVELGGVLIPKNSIVHACNGAANRDPARWGESAGRFDPGRPLRSHLGFGNGAHICLGMHLARAEMTTAITKLVQRFPALRLDPDRPAPQLTGVYERGADSVPVLLH